MSDENEKKKTPQERLVEAIAEAQADEALERIEKMSDEEIAKELADAGVDMEEEERRMAALLAKHGADVGGDEEAKDANDAKVVPLAARRAPGPAIGIGLAVAAAVLAAIAWQASKRQAAPTDKEAERTPQPTAPAPSETGVPPLDDTRDLVTHPPPNSDAGAAADAAARTR